MFRLVALTALVAVAAAHPQTYLPAQWRSGYIVNGDDVDSAETYPFIAALESRSGSLRCTGSIINSTFILTAAHCTDGWSPSQCQIRVGTNTRSGGETYACAAFTEKRGYNDGNGFSNNDVAIIELESSISFDSTKQPVNLQDLQPASGSEVLMIGWGRVSGGGALPSTLQQVISDYATDSECQSSWGSSYNPATMICEKGSSVGACNGDSGGPMMCYSDDGEEFQCGVTSWGASGCTVSLPSVYAEVVKFLDFILDGAA